MTQLTDKLIAVLVSNDSFSFSIDKAIYTNIYDNTKGKSLDIISHKEEDFNIIGTVTKDNIDFDCVKYVNFHCITRLSIFGYINYVKTKLPNTDYTCRTKEESFISLLNSKDLFLDKLDNQKILILEKL